jgi:hypothetical protein
MLINQEVGMECPDCGKDLEYKEGYALTRAAHYKWLCTNDECQSEHITDETGRFLDRE